ncbi:hypothetical protein NJ76_05780 [Rhodococcus sp. IITR03]|nr:hypothetical protein NJ76_05780 [Rhodococcus sp. IITR03]
MRDQTEHESGVALRDLEGDQLTGLRERFNHAVELADLGLGGADRRADRILDRRARRVQGEDIVDGARGHGLHIVLDGGADRVPTRCHEISFVRIWNTFQFDGSGPDPWMHSRFPLGRPRGGGR